MVRNWIGCCLAMTRTFIALEFHPEVQRQLAEVTRRLALAVPSVRWVDPAGIHLTLAFLGELDETRLDTAIAVTEQVAQQLHSFSYRLSHPGIFGSQRQPRVIWMGIEEPSQQLARAHALLNQELERRGFEIDRRPFSPHLTLARLKAPLPPTELQSLQRLLADRQQRLVEPTAYPVQHLNVMKSELRPSGARYTRLIAAP